jgi:hypothetical protein
MSNTTAGVWTNIFRVGHYLCEMSYRLGAGIAAQWTPDVPRGPLSAEDMAAYRRGRDALVGEVAAALGQGVIVLEAS